MPCNARQHANACAAVKNHLERKGYRQRRNLASPVPGRADFTVWGMGACTLELEIKTGKAKQSRGQLIEQDALASRGALYRCATVGKLPNAQGLITRNGRWDMSQVDLALQEMDRLNLILANVFPVIIAGFKQPIVAAL